VAPGSPSLHFDAINDAGGGLPEGELAALPGRLSLPEALERTEDASELRSSLKRCAEKCTHLYMY